MIVSLSKSNWFCNQLHLSLFLTLSSHDPVLVHKSISGARQTCLRFSQNSQVLLVGDSKGEVSVYLPQNTAPPPRRQEDALLNVLNSLDLLARKWQLVNVAKLTFLFAPQCVSALYLLFSTKGMLLICGKPLLSRWRCMSRERERKRDKMPLAKGPTLALILAG